MLLLVFISFPQSKLSAHGAAMLSRDTSLSACSREVRQLGEPPAMRCRWEGCQEEVGETQEGLTDTAGALVELSVDGVLEWLQPIDFYIHVSGHAYTETGYLFVYILCTFCMTLHLQKK